MNSIYDIFPKELWILIILEIPYSEIPNIYKNKSHLSKAFKKLVSDENLLERKKNINYPRINRSCKYYDIQKDISKTLWSINHSHYNEKPLELALDEVSKDLSDVVRGDLIELKSNKQEIFIFDGNKILNDPILKNDVLHLPIEFDPINNNIPVEYWIKNDKSNKSNKFSKIKFYFNVCYVREQLLSNISMLHERYGGVYTSCIVNNISYVIMDNPNNKKYIKTDEVILKFKKMLETTCRLYLTYETDYVEKYIFEINDVQNVYIITN